MLGIALSDLIALCLLGGGIVIIPMLLVKGVRCALHAPRQGPRIDGQFLSQQNNLLAHQDGGRFASSAGGDPSVRELFHDHSNPGRSHDDLTLDRPVDLVIVESYAGYAPEALFGAGVGSGLGSSFDHD